MNCKDCGREFSAKQNLTEHQHSALLRLQSAECGELFRKQGQVAQHHFRMHQRVFPRPAIRVSLPVPVCIAPATSSAGADPVLTQHTAPSPGPAQSMADSATAGKIFAIKTPQQLEQEGARIELMVRKSGRPNVKFTTRKKPIEVDLAPVKSSKVQWHAFARRA